jgi:hypothetical protein
MKKKYYIILYDGYFKCINDILDNYLTYKPSKLLYVNNFIQALYYKFYMKKYSESPHCKTKIFRNDLDIIEIRR